MPLTPQSLGFTPLNPGESPAEQAAWQLEVGGEQIRFRLLRQLAELMPVETIERETLGMSDLDVIPASELIVVPETGGEVIGAFRIDSDGRERIIAAGYGWGGFFAGRPRLVSDFLGVKPEARSLGIGAAMKRLQAAVATRAGFVEIVWTVDPLRAANARLNFLKLGAYSHHYERDRYGQEFGQAHYGGLPSDRLHITWPLTSRRVHEVLLNPGSPQSPLLPDGVRLVSIPDNIDEVLNGSPEAALTWRLRTRDELEASFADGWAVTAFAPADRDRSEPALILEQLPMLSSGAPDIDASAFRHPVQEGATS